MSASKRQKIVAVYMSQNSVGIGPGALKSVRVGRDRVELFERDDDRGFVYVTLRPAGAPKAQHYKIPLSAISFIEVESPAATDEPQEKKS
jgi:hypothetical protein